MDIHPTAKVALLTTKGKIEIELFAKELPLSCREFLKNCVNNKYTGLEFAMVTSSLIQTSQLEVSPEIKQERNTRIKFQSRGAVGLLRVDGTKRSSASGFFISLQPVTEYGQDYVFIGNVIGESIYNVVKIQDSELKEGTDCPLYPVKIVGCEVPEPYFDDLEEQATSTESKKRKRGKTTVQLEYEDDEEEGPVSFVVRSAHELLGERKRTKTEDAAPEPNGPASVILKGQEGRQPSTNAAEEKLKHDAANTGEDSQSSNEVTSTKSHASEQTNEVPETKSVEVKKPTHAKKKNVRDFTIDPYDSDLDFSEDEISYEMLRKHKFICR